MNVESESLVGRRYWRSFLPMWLFPIALFATIFLPGSGKHSVLYLVAFDFPLMFLCGYPSLSKWRQWGISPGQMFFWFAIVPFLIWVLMILGLFGLYFLGEWLWPSTT